MPRAAPRGRPSRGSSRCPTIPPAAGAARRRNEAVVPEAAAVPRGCPGGDGLAMSEGREGGAPRPVIGMHVRPGKVGPARIRRATQRHMSCLRRGDNFVHKFVWSHPVSLGSSQSCCERHKLYRGRHPRAPWSHSYRGVQCYSRLFLLPTPQSLLNTIKHDVRECGLNLLRNLWSYLLRSYVHCMMYSIPLHHVGIAP